VNGKLLTRLNVGALATVLIVLTMVAVSWWVTFKVEAACDRQTQSIAAAKSLTEAAGALWHLRTGVPEYMVADAERRARIAEEQQKWSAVIETNLAAFESTTHSREEAEALAELRAQYLRFKEAWLKFVGLYQARRSEEALAWRELTVAPYAAATVRALGSLIRQHRKHQEEGTMQMAEWLQRNQRLISLLSVLLLSISMLGYWGGRRALRPAAELQARAQHVLRERLGATADLASPGENEVEALARSFDTVVAAFTARQAALTAADAAQKRHQDDLEKTVAARTVEVEASNWMLAARERQTRSITELTSLLQTVRDLDEAARILPQFLEPLFAPHAGALYLAKPSLNSLDLMVRWRGASPAGSFEFSDCWALRRGETYAVEQSGLVCPHSAEFPAAGGYVCVPMFSQGVTFGLLHLAYASPVDDASARERRDYARVVAEQLALALANLRLREALRDQALRDPLTGLFNRRFLEETLGRELALAAREGRALSVLMLDVDHFKHFNDTQGHDAGDAVLRGLARILAEGTRAGDIVCRFGGEEFAVMLPRATADDAISWAERLMQRIGAMAVRVGGQRLPRVTVSIGLACYPHDGGDIDALVKAADVALYEAKRTGRNRIVTAAKLAADAGRLPLPVGEPAPAQAPAAARVGT
jgi:diguanylate cyclase (GGDEF)-like protein